MSAYQQLEKKLRAEPSTWLVTGAAGFIGSHLVETLLSWDQHVVGMDNFATGYKRNLDLVEKNLSAEQWSNFRFVEGDIRKPEDCAKACNGVQYVLHQAALGSVPRSIEDPVTSNAVNVSGFLEILKAAKDANVKRFVFASSSSVYGDAEGLPKKEPNTGNPLSPYAVTKAVNELYASVFLSVYGIETIGLRYFNVFGPRQDPAGAYAAVIPRWVGEFFAGKYPEIFGDGKTSRDFCYVKNAVQANLLAACTPNEKAVGKFFNVSYGGQETLTDLYVTIAKRLSEICDSEFPTEPKYVDFRQGDVRHSRADISLACELLGYEPQYSLSDGLAEALVWYVEDRERKGADI